MNRITKNKQSGFTFLEAVLVISIIIILTAIIIPNYKNAQAEFALDRSAHKLAQDIRRVAEMALSSQRITNPNNLAEQAIPDGYGIRIDSSSNILIFIDCNNNKSFEGGNDCNLFSPNIPEKIEDLSLEKGVSVESISPSSPLDIVFIPPNPEVFINGGDATAVITLKNNSGVRKVMVNKAGLISEE